MYAVEKLSSYITRGVYTVSGPFHPFGGAVDIIVVQQQDGSFKSSPWYVRFGKFQGVLKTTEKVVTICVNGVESRFHMHLDHKGEAYFLKDCDSDEPGDFEMSPPSSGDEMGEKLRASLQKAQSLNYDVPFDTGNGKIVTRTNSKRSRIFGLVFGNKSMKENDQQANVDRGDRASSLECAEIAADLLETKWSTNLSSNDSRTNSPNGKNNFDVSTNDNSMDSYHEGTDVTIEQSVASHVEKLGDNLAREVHFEGTITQTSTSQIHEEVFELYTLKTGDLSERSTPVSESVMLQSDESNISSKGSVHHPGSTSDGEKAPEVNNDGEKEDDPISYARTSESTTVSLDVSSGEVTCLTSEHIFEVTSREESENVPHEENYIGGGTQDLELSMAEVSSVLEDSQQAYSPSNDRNGSNSDSPRKSWSLESEVIDGEIETTEISKEIATEKAETVGFVQNLCQVIGEEASDISFILHEDQESKIPSNDVILENPCLQNSPIIAQDESRFPESENLEDEQFQFSDIHNFSKEQIAAAETNDSRKFLSIEGDIEEHESESTNNEDCYESVLGSQTSPMAIPKSPTVQWAETELLTQSLPIIRSEIHDLGRTNLLHSLSRSIDLNSESFEHDLVKKEIRRSSMLQSDSASEAIDSENKRGDSMRPISSSVENSQGMIAVGQDENNLTADPSEAIVAAGGSWRLWPFSLKKSQTISTVHSVPESIPRENLDVLPMRSQSLTGHDDIQKAKFTKKKVRSLTPTSEELASLNLKEGRNVITFSFSTAMLGQQQVDARIYLWKWNTRIVISDVDGTITKSDVLGQFMPLVGKDWSQTGVAHLFSAIKENGYQLLFLSARAISQAYLTRQFLFNIKQDGKALPDGPVVISPDGLFPSLYREVIRRAPHEFKISCLEDIRALFPTECNPFYAGFGNRDTDEFSYLKVGIPKGKIFIINPKGEVAVNHRVETKSYTSLHALVNGMFPPTSTTEQEDFNSWNYWRLPLPDV